MAKSNPTPIVIFDLDGTLIDTAPDLVGTLNIVLAEERLPSVALEQARPLIGAGIRPLIERALAEQKRNLPTEQVDEMFARFLGHYQNHIADLSRPYPGVEGALDRLADNGLRLAVCTNKYEALSLRLLDALGLAQRFAAICGQDTFPMKKPDPETLRLTIARAGGDPGQAVMVGDSSTDVELARAAAVPVVGVDFGYTQTPMAELAPDRLIGHFDSLPAAVGELLPRIGAMQVKSAAIPVVKAD